MKQNASYARRGGLISAIPLGSLSMSTRTCQEACIFVRTYGSYSTVRRFYFCTDGNDLRGLVLRFLSLMRWASGGFMKKKTKADPIIRNIRIEPCTKQSITRMLHAWARSKKLEVKEVEKIK